MKPVNSLYSSVILLTAILTFGCSVPKQVGKNPDIIPPASYQEEIVSDSSSVADLSFSEYFKDSLLVALIEDVLANNIEGKVAVERVKIAEALLRQRRAAFFPSVNLVAEGSGTRYGRHTIEGVGNFDTNLSPNIEKSQQVNTRVTPNYWLGAEVQWEADLWGRLKQMKLAARERFLATAYGQQLLRSTLVSQAAVLYYELIALDLEADILQKNIALQRQALEIVKVQKEAGRATELAVQQFQAQLANTEATDIAIRQQIIAAENDLLLLSGRFEGTLKRSKDISVDAISYLAKHGQPRQLLQFRPDIQASFRELEASRADAKAARAAFFPSLGVSAYGGYHSFNAQHLFNPTSLVFQLLGNATTPLFQRHQIRSQFKIATAAQEIAFREYEKSVLTAFHEVRTLLAYIENTEKMLGIKSVESNALNKSVDLSTDLYVAGYANYLEIISAQKSKLNADMDLVTLQLNRAQALVRIYKALGGGWR